jgi:hypothetical protein
LTSKNYAAIILLANITYEAMPIKKLSEFLGQLSASFNKKGVKDK